MGGLIGNHSEGKGACEGERREQESEAHHVAYACEKRGACGTYKQQMTRTKWTFIAKGNLMMKV